MSIVNKAIEEQILGASLKHIDTGALAKQLAPILEKELIRNIKVYLEEELDYGELLYEAGIDKIVTNIIKNLLLNPKVKVKKNARK